MLGKLHKLNSKLDELDKFIYAEFDELDKLHAEFDELHKLSQIEWCLCFEVENGKTIG